MLSLVLDILSAAVNLNINFKNNPILAGAVNVFGNPGHTAAERNNIQIIEQIMLD
jgi:hypothetical protein